MSLLDRFSLGEGFKKYFEISAAFDDDGRDAVFGIRHEVYCEELGFEPVRPDRREKRENGERAYVLRPQFPGRRFVSAEREKEDRARRKGRGHPRESRRAAGPFRHRQRESYQSQKDMRGYELKLKTVGEIRQTPCEFGNVENQPVGGIDQARAPHVFQKKLWSSGIAPIDEWRRSRAQRDERRHRRDGNDRERGDGERGQPARQPPARQRGDRHNRHQSGG